MSLASQNRFAYLGNDEDGDEKPNVPVKTVDKVTPRTTKRNVEPQAPQAPVRATAGNRRGASGNDGAFRDRNAGSDRNHGRSTDEAPRGGARGGAGARVRGGRGSRNPRDRDDRHTSKTGAQGGSDKQAAASWGANEGDAELKDEQAGDAIAQSEKKAAAAEDGAEEPTEPEDKSVSYVDYLAQLAEKKLALAAETPKVRSANEGSKLDKKWAAAKPLDKDEEEEVWAAPAGGKAKRERERKTKQTVDFDPRFVEPERTRGGGAGGPRGGRGGRGGERGGAGRGGERGNRGGNSAPRGGARGGRDNAAAPINTRDESAFPSLGK